MLNASDRAGSAGAADAELAVGVAAVEVIVAGVAAEAPPAPARSHGLGGEPADMMCF